VITWPLCVLALFSVVGGLIGIEQLYRLQFPAGPAGHTVSFLGHLIAPFVHAPMAAITGLVAVLVGFAAAYALYAKAAKDPLPEKLTALSRAMRNRFYFDEIYQATVIRLHDLLTAISDWFDRWIIAGVAVRGTHGTTELAGRALRLLQTGNLQTYAFLFALGVALVLYLALR
jgi:NADH-quinone oxidoreductase subunit L